MLLRKNGRCLGNKSKTSLKLYEVCVSSWSGRRPIAAKTRDERGIAPCLIPHTPSCALKGTLERYICAYIETIENFASSTRYSFLTKGLILINVEWLIQNTHSRGLRRLPIKMEWVDFHSWIIFNGSSSGDVECCDTALSEGVLVWMRWAMAHICIRNKRVRYCCRWRWICADQRALTTACVYSDYFS